MQIKCKQCGKLNEGDSKFCDECGASFSDDVLSVKTDETVEITPAEQAAAIISKTKAKTDQTTKAAQKIWKGLLFPEQMIAAGAIMGIVSFFLPWMKLGINMEKTSGSGFEIAKEWGGLYLYLVAMLASLAMIYFSQGATIKAKIKLARWQIVLGTFLLTIGTACLILVSSLVEAFNKLIEGFLGAFGSYGSEYLTASVSIGMWMLLLSALLIVIGAFKLQSKLLDIRKG